MIPELGNFSLILALALSVMLGALPIIGSRLGIHSWVGFARPAALALVPLVGFSYACLTISFLQNDFSVTYVANNSNTHLPLIYKLSGVWGGHEGSLLLWILTLSLWTGAVGLFSRGIPPGLSAIVLSVLGMITAGFSSFTLFTSNPFERLVPAPPEGIDLNPLLQDIGMALHPPILYQGYVGFSVAFAFAIAALISGRFDAAWARWTRPWTNIAWMFLTIGIALGSWWAYYELGWGGWWFWDPVENASFMPWLIGTALIHSLAATEKRGVFKAWTILLAVIAFSLSLLGTFLVRSGVLISVHSFASDPTRGLFILIFLGIVIGGSLLLYAWRAPGIVSRVRFGTTSREMAILLNNIIFGILCFAVLLGTLYPLIMDALNLGKISVGPPYFNFVFTIIGLPLALLIGVGALLHWKKDRLNRVSPGLLVCLILALITAVGIPLLLFHTSLGASAGLFAGSMIIFLSLKNLIDRTRPGNRIRSILSTPKGIFGMVIAHLGMGIFVIGVTMTTVYSIERDIRLAPGEQYQIGEYHFVFDGTDTISGPNYQAVQGSFRIFRDDEMIARLFPEKRTYLIQKNPMTEAAIDPGITRDLYIALGEPLSEAADGNQPWAVRIYYKPFVRWIWLGALIMAIGGLFGAADKRYRRSRATPLPSAQPEPGGS